MQHVAPPAGMHVKYIAEINGGREVTLIGAASYDYWMRELTDEELVPLQSNNRAEILLSAVELKWMGVRFSEVSVSVSVHERGRPDKAGIFLAAAFNTSNLFALIERNWFHTPYRHANVIVSTQQPWSFQVTEDGQIMLSAARNATSTPNAIDTIYEGPIYVPSRRARERKRPEVFFAKLAGETQIVPFDAKRDVVQLTASTRYPIFQSLIDSSFTAVEWRVRRNATHARSKTYKRGSNP